MPCQLTKPNTRIENILQWQPIEGPCSLQYVASIVPVSLDKSSHDLTSLQRDLLPELHKRSRRFDACSSGKAEKDGLQVGAAFYRCDCARAVQEMFFSCPTFRFEAQMGGPLLFDACTKPPPLQTWKKAADESVLSLAPPAGGLQRVLTCLVESYLLSLAFTCLRPVKGGVLLCSRPCISLPDKCPK